MFDEDKIPSSFYGPDGELTDEMEEKICEQEAIMIQKQIDNIFDDYDRTQ